MLKDHSDCINQTVMTGQMSLCDSLTGLPNRIYFYDRLIGAMNYAQRNNGLLTVICAGVGDMKSVNETLGIDAGDMILQQFSHRLKECFASRGWLVARLFGNEFAVLLEGTGKEEAVAAAKDLQAACSRWFVIKGIDMVPKPCIGIVEYPSDGSSAETLLMHAQAAMNLSRQQGSRGYQFFYECLHHRTVRAASIGNRLGFALRNRELTLHYQPQVDLSSGEIIAVEALLRWNQCELGQVPPAEFIPLAEQTGLIHAIGQWVLKTACRQNKRWQDSGMKPIRMAVNISGIQFHYGDLAASVRAVLEETQLEPRYLELEITESTAIDAEQTIAHLQKLKALGVGVAIDDFGTGYSSLRYLKDFPIDKLKIDKSFLDDIIDDPEDNIIVSTIVAIAHNLKLKVIAEGVETKRQQELLRAIGCDEIQGYLVSKPLSAEDMTCLLYEANIHAKMRELGLLSMNERN